MREQSEGQVLMLLDTAGLYCYLDDGDARHREAVSLLDAATVRLTHSYVLAELVALCTARAVDRQVTLEFVSELANDPLVVVVWVGQAEHQSALELLHARLDNTDST